MPRSLTVHWMIETSTQLQDVGRRVMMALLATRMLNYAGLQSIAQIISILSGIIIIRYLSQQDYGYYLLVTAAASTIAMVSETGITNSMSAIGGRVWGDMKSVSRLLTTAMKLKGRLFLLGILLAAPVIPGT